MPQTDKDDLVFLAAWAIGALCVGARGDGKSAISELAGKIEAHPTLPKGVGAHVIADLHAARVQMSAGGGGLPEFLLTRGVAGAARRDLEEDIQRCPLLGDSARAKLLSELRPLRGDAPEALLEEIALMRRLAEAAVVLDRFEEGLDVSLVKFAFTDPLAKSGAMRELLPSIL